APGGTRWWRRSCRTRRTRWRGRWAGTAASPRCRGSTRSRISTAAPTTRSSPATTPTSRPGPTTPWKWARRSPSPPASSSSSTRRSPSRSSNASRRPRKADPETEHPAPLAAAEFSLPGELAADVADAETALAAFDSHAAARLGAQGPALGPMNAVLLRTESAASSQIEDLTVGARQLALAVLDESRSGNARAVVANVRMMKAALRLAAELDLEAILAMHEELLEGTVDAGRLRRQLVWVGRSGLSPLGPSMSRARNSTRSCIRSEEHTSELQSRFALVCRLLLEKTNCCPENWYRRTRPAFAALLVVSAAAARPRLHTLSLHDALPIWRSSPCTKSSWKARWTPAASAGSWCGWAAAGSVRWGRPCRGRGTRRGPASDRKSTRLNSSHVSRSYAVFCLKKQTAAQKTGIVARARRSPLSSSFLPRRRARGSTPFPSTTLFRSGDPRHARRAPGRHGGRRPPPPAAGVGGPQRAQSAGAVHVAGEELDEVLH